MPLQCTSFSTASKLLQHQALSLYQTAFPQVEQIPFSYLKSRAKKENIDFFILTDGEQFIGITYLITKHQITFILYLAINEKLRHHGYGSQVLQSIKALKPSHSLVLTIEIVDNTYENFEERVNRKKFYLKNEFKCLPYNLTFSKIEKFEVLSTTSQISQADLVELFKEFSTVLAPILFTLNLIKFESVDNL